MKMTTQELCKMRLDIDWAADKIRSVIRLRPKGFPTYLAAELAEALALLERHSLDDEKPAADDL